MIGHAVLYSEIMVLGVSLENDSLNIFHHNLLYFTTYMKHQVVDTERQWKQPIYGMETHLCLTGARFV